METTIYGLELRINKPPPLKGLNLRIPIIIPIKGREFILQGSAGEGPYDYHVTPVRSLQLGLGFRV